MELHDYTGNTVHSGNRIDYKGIIYDILKVYTDRVKARGADNQIVYLTPAQVSMSDRMF